MFRKICSNVNVCKILPKRKIEPAKIFYFALISSNIIICIKVHMWSFNFYKKIKTL